MKGFIILLGCLFICWGGVTCSNPYRLSLDKWTYIQVDSTRGKWGDWDKPEWLRYFGLFMADVDDDGDQDIVAGRYWYRNPGGDMGKPWQRIDFGLNVDAMLVVNVDDDEFTDVIAQALPDVYWLEAMDILAEKWKALSIGNLPPTHHINGQGYRLAQIVSGGKPEILLTARGGVYCCEIPARPDSDPWQFVLVAKTDSEEGFDAGDIDGDGDLDIVAGNSNHRDEEPLCLLWWENPGALSEDWRYYEIGNTIHAIDRVQLADLNGDNRLDVVVTEERWPGEAPDAHLYWFEQPKKLTTNNWARYIIFTEYSLNNLDVADIDQDGDVDIVTNEHKGITFKLQIWENDGQGRFTEYLIDTGKEGHLGAQLSDMDGDGDLDIVSAAWDHYQYLHLWRNDAITADRTGMMKSVP